MSKRISPPFKNFQCICSLIHQVKLCQHTNCPFTCWINFSRYFDSIRCCNILIGWTYGQNDAIWLLNI
uniref:Uncharacterized protein MANES_17G017500 n=1 Tax=Rhizophora mucronata TaxID=61149 RepID=A0A2P2J3H7_RHIMU